MFFAYSSWNARSSGAKMVNLIRSLPILGRNLERRVQGLVDAVDDDGAFVVDSDIVDGEISIGTRRSCDYQRVIRNQSGDSCAARKSLEGFDGESRRRDVVAEEEQRRLAGAEESLVGRSEDGGGGGVGS